MRKLVRARQSVRQDIVGAQDELRSQTDGERLRPTQEPLSNGIEQGRPGSSCLAQIRHRSDDVAEDCDRLSAQRRLKVEETVPDGKQLPGVDGKRRLLQVPKAGSDEGTQMSTPPDVRGV